MNASSGDTANGMAERRSGGKRGMQPAAIASWLTLALAVAFFILFLVQAGTFSSFGDYPEPAPVKDVTQEKVVVSISSISGFDREQQPYTINSQSAVQDPQHANLINLKTISGKLRKSNGTRFSFDAKTGVYDSDSKTLDLAGDVHIISVGRFVATMPNAEVSLRDKQLTSDARVQVQFDSGDIVANGVRITNDGKDILFLNRVKARLRGAASKENKSDNE
jgi:LPS export ABC transporter protein LptC